MEKEIHWRLESSCRHTSMSDNRRERQQRNNLQSLLNWAIVHSDENALAMAAAGTPSQGTPIDRKWMDALLPDEFAEMKELLEFAEDSEKRGPEERVQMLEKLEMICESVDNANDLDKINGIRRLLRIIFPSEGITLDRSQPVAPSVLADDGRCCASSVDDDLQDEIRAKAASVLHVCVGNNPPCAHQLVASGGIYLFLSLLSQSFVATACVGSSPVSSARRPLPPRVLVLKALSIVSACCNNNVPISRLVLAYATDHVFMEPLVEQLILREHERRAVFCLFNLARACPRELSSAMDGAFVSQDSRPVRRLLAFSGSAAGTEFEAELRCVVAILLKCIPSWASELDGIAPEVLQELPAVDLEELVRTTEPKALTAESAAGAQQAASVAAPPAADR